MSNGQEEYLSFEEFRTRVGFSAQKVRAALMALRLTPQTLPGDMRRLVYLASWVSQVQKYLRDIGAGR